MIFMQHGIAIALVSIVKKNSIYHRPSLPGYTKGNRRKELCTELC